MAAPHGVNDVIVCAVRPYDYQRVSAEFVNIPSEVSDKIDHPREERVDGTRQDVGTFGRVGGAGVDGRGDAHGEERKAERRRGKKARGEGAG